jgi:hypothetical protein
MKKSISILLIIFFAYSCSTLETELPRYKFLGTFDVRVKNLPDFNGVAIIEKHKDDDDKFYLKINDDKIEMNVNLKKQNIAQSTEFNVPIFASNLTTLYYINYDTLNLSTSYGTIFIKGNLKYKDFVLVRR